MSKPQVVRVRNPAALQIDEVRDLMVRFLSSNRLVRSPSDALRELLSGLHMDQVGLFLVYEDERWVGATLAQLSQSAFNPYCIVVHIHNEGSKAAVAALRDAIYDYAEAAGYDMVLGIDANDKPAGFERLFASRGEPQKLGGVYLLPVGGYEDLI